MIPEVPTAPAGPQADAAADFDECVGEYVEISSQVSVTAQVTPVVLEGWERAYQDASALAAEGDYEGALAACRETVGAMQAALG